LFTSSRAAAPPAPHKHLPSFPTRRSSDLLLTTAGIEDGDLLERGQRDLVRRRVGEADVVELDGHRALRDVDGVGSVGDQGLQVEDRKSTRLNSSHVSISYAVFCLKKTKAD